MENAISSLIQGEDVCVLATAQDNVPHASLMAYVPSEDSTTFFMATYRNTRKFANIQANPGVCLLLDDRSGHDRERRLETRALTVHGRAEVIQDRAEQEAVLALLRSRLPHLRDFLASDEIACIAVRAGGFQLLHGPVSAVYEEA